MAAAFRTTLVAFTLALAGCQAPGEFDGVQLGLKRDHYVLPPPPPPPDPIPYEQLRALQAEWPPVDVWVPPNGEVVRVVRWDRPSAMTTIPGRNHLPHCGEPAAAGRACKGRPVIIRVSASQREAVPTLVILEAPR